jgi:predicted DNA-binding transcriptional regulator AlpA
MKTRRLLKKSEILYIVNCGKTKFDEMVEKGDFPDYVTLPNGRTRLWDSNVVDAWLDAQIAKSKSARELHKSNPLNALFSRLQPNVPIQISLTDHSDSPQSVQTPKAQAKKIRSKV